VGKLSLSKTGAFVLVFCADGDCLARADLDHSGRFQREQRCYPGLMCKVCARSVPRPYPALKPLGYHVSPLRDSLLSN